MQTPRRMKMPERIRPVPNQPVWKVNTQQEPVDEMYDRFMGRVPESFKEIGEKARGRDVLPDEVKVSFCKLPKQKKRGLVY